MAKKGTVTVERLSAEVVAELVKEPLKHARETFKKLEQWRRKSAQSKVVIG